MKKNKIIKIILVLTLIALIAIANVYFRPLLNQLPGLIQQYKQLAVLIYAGIYILGTVLFLPGLVLTLTAGFLFGPWFGGAIALISATIGASFAFLIARYISSDWVADKAHGILKKLIDGINKEGWRFVAFVRLVPLFPFNLVNYAFGLTKINLIPYMLTSFVCMLPGAMAYAYLGSLGQAALYGETAQLIKKVMIGIALLAVAFFIPHVVKRIRKKNGD